MLDGFEECIDHKMPGYARDGVVEIAFANQKHYVSLYVLRNDVMDAHRASLRDLDVGKACIRYRDRDEMDLDLVRSILRSTAESSGPVCD
jgi:uncharacterized protein YdhG (YjbR/CyaY superfamily)